MANLYLGLTQSGASLLPRIRWINGRDPSLATDYSKNIEKVNTLGGSQRFNIKSHHPAKWTLAWDMLTVAELTAMKVLKAYNQALWFQNNWEDSTWHEVVITTFQPQPFLRAGATTCRYSLAMTLEEIE